MNAKNVTSVVLVAPMLLLSWLPQPGGQRPDLPGLRRPGRSIADRQEQPGNNRLRFVPNLGQFDTQVRFQARAGRETLWVMDDGLWLTFLEGTEGTEGIGGTQGTISLSPCPLVPLSPYHQHGVNLRLRFLGISLGTPVTRSDVQPGRMNYFRGQDTSRWQSDVPTYAAVRWETKTPGGSLVLRGREVSGGIDLTVETQAETDLPAIQLQVEGANQLVIDANGYILASTASGVIPLPKLIDGGRSLPAWVTGNTIRFQPAGADWSQTLEQRSSPIPGQTAGRAIPDSGLVDLVYSTFLGGTGSEYGYAIAVDASGATYVTGWTESPEFPTTPGAFDRTVASWDAFVTKLTGRGNSLVYSTFVGGSSYDFGNAIAVDADGSAYITGRTSSLDFPTTAGAFDTQFNGARYNDVFVTKLSPSGSALSYSTYVGGTEDEVGYGIALDANREATVIGQTYSSSFPTTAGAFDRTCGTDGLCNYYNNTYYNDVFVTRLNTSGSGLVYSTFIGGNDQDFGYAIAVDNAGAAYVTGYVSSYDYPVTAGVYDPDLDGSSDGFVTKLNASGGALVYSTYLGGRGTDVGYSLAIDGSGNVYLTGYTGSDDYPTTTGAFDEVMNGYNDGFVSKVNPNGTGLIYSTYLGGSGSYEIGYGIAVNPANEAYVTGQTDSNDFPTTSNAFDTSYNGGGTYGFDSYLVKLNSQGSSLAYGTYLGGSVYEDVGNAIALNSAGLASITGYTGSADFPTTAGTYDPSFNGGLWDSYVAKVSPGLPVAHVASVAPFYSPNGNRYRIGTTVTIQDTTGNGVSGATVGLQVTQPDGHQVSVSRTTNTSGLLTISAYTTERGQYTFAVTSVTKSGWVYDASENVETSDSITIPEN